MYSNFIMNNKINKINSQMADIVPLLSKLIMANKNRFGVILDDTCDSLTGWAATGTVTVSSGKFNFAASSNIAKAINLSKIMPTVITCELTKNGLSAFGIYLYNGSNNIVGAVAVDVASAQNSVITYSPSSGNANEKTYNSANPFRLYLLYDPIKSVIKGFIQDDGTSGAKYIGSSPVTGIPVTLKLLTGSVHAVDVQVDNLIMAPVYGAVIGDSRVAGHGTNGYDPYPSYYPGTYYPNMAFAYDFYKDVGVYLINDGVGSTLSAFNLARIANTIQFSPKVMIIGPSNLGESVGTFESNFAAMATACINAGIKPIMMEIPPCNQPDYADEIISINAWMNNYCQQNGIQLIKLYNLMANGTNLKSTFDVGDGTHLSEIGARFVANLIEDAIA